MLQRHSEFGAAMQLEQYDFAIFGSELDAAILAVTLSTKFDARVLLIRDHVNDYALQTHYSASMTATADAKLVKMLETGEAHWHELFSSREARQCFDRGPVHVDVAAKANINALNYVENTMVYAQRQCDRKARPNGSEFLELRAVTMPKRREALEYLYAQYNGANCTFMDRSDFNEIRRLKKGQLNLRRGDDKFTAAQTILLDADVIIKEYDQALPATLLECPLNTCVIAPETNADHPRTYFFDCAGQIAQTHDGNIATTSLLGHNAFLEAINSRDVFGESSRITSKSQKKHLISKSGAPWFEKQNSKGVVSLVVDPIVSPFLVADFATGLSADSLENESSYWCDKSGDKPLSRDVPGLSALIGGANANA